MKRAVSAESLNDVEIRSFVEAVDVFRAAPSSPGFFHSAPIRDDSGRFSEVGFYADSDGQNLLATVRIGDGGKPQSPEWKT